MTPGSGPTFNYTFDASSNLTTLPNGAVSTTGYDKAGELNSATLAGTTTTYTYSAAGQRLTSKQGSGTITTGSWNGASQLTSYTSTAGSLTAATYNGDGQRATSTTNAGTQQFVWDTVPNVPEMLMDSQNAYIYCGGLAPTEQVNLTTGAVTYLVADSLGSIRGIVNAAGNLTAKTSYDAWGNPATAGGLTSVTPFGYAGGYTDPTGLIYLINRYYDPQTGQFTSLDPAIHQTLAPYGYAGGDPVEQTDPTGLWRCGHVPTWSEYRRCWIYMHEHLVHKIELAATLAAVAATICWALSGGTLTMICGVADGIFAAVAAWVYYYDYGHGEYLNIDEWRLTWEYPSGVSWTGHIYWSWGHGPWIPYWAFLSSA